MESRRGFNQIRWANAHRVRDDHDRLMAQIEPEAVAAVGRKRK